MRNDVTAGYIVASVERLREPMQRIADFLDKATHVAVSAEVVALDRRALVVPATVIRQIIPNITYLAL
ncbi:MAG: hypothetical protein KDH15_12225 [Rhodocyclaceae bacterium]|nr:hypothetical protein [Rhodocyclaceae bacterium]